MDVDQILIWEQSVSSFFNELGVSSYPGINKKLKSLSVRVLTCKRPPAPACYCPGCVSRALSWEAWGKSLVAGIPPNVRNDSGSNRRWNAPRPSCHKDTGWDGVSTRAGRAPFPACSLSHEETWSEQLLHPELVLFVLQQVSGCSFSIE